MEHPLASLATAQQVRWVMDAEMEMYTPQGGESVRQRMHRTQILLEPEQYRALVELARLEGRSLSELLRELVREHLAQRDQAADVIRARQMAALERIRQHRQALLERRGGVPLDIDVAALVAAVREERDADISAGSTDDRR